MYRQTMETDQVVEMYGITVIDDSQASQQSDEVGIGITAVVKIKHAALYEAAKVMGGASALARHLGVPPTMLGTWINLQACPPREVNPLARTWTDERIAVMEAKLFELTGKTWEELWPDELRENHAFLKAPKSIEKVYNWKQAAMLSYAEATRTRLIEQAGRKPDEHPEADLQREAIEKNLHLLSLRQRQILKWRYGFDCKPKSYEEVAKELKITGERVRQIECRAIEKLRSLASLSMFVGGLKTPTASDSGE